ncbi:hypothetical protein HMPREF0518_1899 [Lactobacillus helveticus DSM 20075 = CGMCC 1.1877]|nr:hypothetical protein HMPREF0518_1899 [Lactobacillus helveticus DSM 20075 = CGMCC 1.1877]
MLFIALYISLKLNKNNYGTNTAYRARELYISLKLNKNTL